MKPEMSDFLYREILILALFLLLGGLFILDISPPENFRYPLSLSPAQKAQARTIGKVILLIG